VLPPEKKFYYPIFVWGNCEWLITQSLNRTHGARTASRRIAAFLWMLLKLLHKAADTAEANSRRGLETAQQLSDKLEAAKDRINELEGHLEFYRGKIERAEAWLYKIASEIEDRLIREPGGTQRGTSSG
jgi:hypothetical protein